MTVAGKRKTCLQLNFVKVSNSLFEVHIVKEILNSYGTDRVNPPRDNMAVYCQKVNFGFYEGNEVKLT